jgi:hypothetical protein
MTRTQSHCFQVKYELFDMLIGYWSLVVQARFSSG